MTWRDLTLRFQPRFCCDEKGNFLQTSSIKVNRCKHVLTSCCRWKQPKSSRSITQTLKDLLAHFRLISANIVGDTWDRCVNNPFHTNHTPIVLASFFLYISIIIASQPPIVEVCWHSIHNGKIKCSSCASSVGVCGENIRRTSTSHFHLS